MEIVTLIPAVFCILAMFRGKTSYAFLTVVLPVLLLFPSDYYWTVRPIPPINFIDCALLPLGVGMLLTNLRDWKLTRVDLWMTIYVISTFYADYASGRTTAAILLLFVTLAINVVPYMAGKLLIEQHGARIQTVKTIVWLTFIAAIFSMPDYFFKLNIYERFWARFYPGQWSGFKLSTRWGFGRLSGPFSQSELAGLMFFPALIFAIWLGYRNYKHYRIKIPQRMVPLKYARLVVFILLLTVFMTQARGPWIGAVLGVTFASIALAKNVPRKLVLVVVGGLAIGIPGYLAVKDYAAGPRTDYGSERETAQYRAQLIDNYLPVAQLGGAWGWGPSFPRVGGQDSVDNNYLLLDLVQGYVGLTSFILILLETTVSLLRIGLTTRSVRDRHFVFSLLGILLGIALTISTVFLGAQSNELFFLLIGWAQVLRPQKTSEESLTTARVTSQTMTKPLTRVYT